MAKYFTRDGLRFLQELRLHNDKEWFDANKPRFEEGVREPALRLVTDLGPVLKKISKHFVADPKPNGGSLSRIYRDTRFSKDKSPYKTELFIQCGHDEGTEAAMPGFYFRIQPGDSIVGGGIWHPNGPSLELIRQAIVKRSAAWTKAKGGGPVGPGCGLGGESLKKVPRGYDPEHPHAEDLRRKDFGMRQPISDAALTGDKLLSELEAGFAAVVPLVKFLVSSVGLPF